MDAHIDALYLLNVFVEMLLAGASLNSWLDHRHVPGVPAWTIGLCFVAAEALMIGLLSRESELAAACRSMVAGGYAMLWIGVRQFKRRALHSVVDRRAARRLARAGRAVAAA